MTRATFVRLALWISAFLICFTAIIPFLINQNYVPWFAVVPVLVFIVLYWVIKIGQYLDFLLKELESIDKH